MLKSKNLFLFLFTIFLIITACVSSSKYFNQTIFEEALANDYELLNFQDNHFYLTTLSDSTSKEVFYTNNKPLISTWSPEGRKIAFLTATKPSLLCCYDITTNQQIELGEFDYNLYVSDENYFNDIIAPQWINNEELIVSDRKGVHLIEIIGNKTQILKGKKIKFICLPSKQQILYADDSQLYLIDKQGNNKIAILEKNSSKNIQKLENVEAFALSRNSKKAAISAGKDIFILDMESFKVNNIHKAKDAVYKLYWANDDKRIVYLCGVPDMKVISMRGLMVDPGNFKFYTMAADGTDLIKICESINYGVYVPMPHISHDGKYISFKTILKNHRKRILIADTAGKGCYPTIMEGSPPAWRP